MTIESEILQTKPFRNLEEKAIVNLIFTHNQIIEKYSKVLKKADLSIPQYNVLRILKGQNQNPITIKGISTRMLDKMSNTSRLVEKLDQKGLVQKKIKSNNLKALDIVISDMGLLLVNKLILELSLIKIGKKFKEKDFENLNKLLDKLRL